MTSNAFFDQVRAAIARDLSAAMKARQRPGIEALRRALGILDNATSAGVLAAPSPSLASTEVARRIVTPADVASLLQAEAQECAAAADEYDRLGQNEWAARLRLEADIIRGCLRHLA